MDDPGVADLSGVKGEVAGTSKTPRGLGGSGGMSRSGVNGYVEQLDGAGETGTDVGDDMTRLEGSEEI